MLGQTAMVVWAALTLMTALVVFALGVSIVVDAAAEHIDPAGNP